MFRIMEGFVVTDFINEIVGTITSWMSGFWNFIKTTIESAIELFYDGTSLTVIGVLALFGLAIGIVYFGLSFVTRFFKK